jgi:hypothetical protein
MRQGRITKRLRTPILGAAAAVALLAGPVEAQYPVGFTPVDAPELGSTAALKLTEAGTGGHTVVGSAPLNGYYIGPYTAVTPSTGLGTPFTVYCVDFSNEIQVGKSWTANVTRLERDPADLSNTRLGLAGLSSVDALDRYSRAVLLAQAFDVVESRTAWSAVQEAIWRLVNPGDAYPSSLVTAAGTYVLDLVKSVDLSEAKYRSLLDGWLVLTVVCATGRGGAPIYSVGVQEFLAHGPALPPTPTVTPEPGTYVMLATGLLGVLLFRRRRRPDES